MERSFRKNSGIPKWLKILFAFVAGLALVVIILSLIFPYGIFGYRFFFFDSRSHSYRQNEDFRYYKLNMKLSSSIQKASPTLEDCSKLLEGGIFNPDSSKFFAGQSNPNYEPKEDCVARNNDAIAAANKHKDLKINYTIANVSGDTVTIPSSWLNAYSTKGSKIYESTKSVTVGPHLTISDSVTTPIGNDTTVSSLNIQIQGLASQTVIGQ